MGFKKNKNMNFTDYNGIGFAILLMILLSTILISLKIHYTEIYSLKNQIKIKDADFKILKAKFDEKSKKISELDFYYKSSIKSMWHDLYLFKFPPKLKKGFENEKILVIDVKLKSSLRPTVNAEMMKNPLVRHLFKELKKIKFEPLIGQKNEFVYMDFEYEYSVFNKEHAIQEIVKEKFIEKYTNQIKETC